jgi:CTP-dependent riboflavin kinase
LEAMASDSSPKYVIEGTVKPQGNGDFQLRMTKFAEVFERAAGDKLFPGTLNAKVDRPVAWKEDFRVRGAEIDEPNQDLLFRALSNKRTEGVQDPTVQPQCGRRRGGITPSK